MDQKRDHDEDQQNPVGKDACYREHTEKKEKAKKQERPFFRKGSIFHLDPDGSTFRAQEGKQNKECGRQCGKRQHQQEKFVQFQAGKRVQIKILRISDRGEHTSQISRDCHQDDQITDSRFHTGHLQDQDAEWHNGDEGDVISDEHTAHKA